MHDAHSVRSVEHAHHRLKDSEGFQRRETTAPLQFSVERLAFYELHHHVNESVACGPQVIDRDGVRMAKAARGLSFASKASEPLGVVAHLRRQDFYCHLVA